MAAFLLIYLTMAMVGLLFSTNKEIFPFYSWFLFSVVPNPGYHYGVNIVSNYNTSFDPPLPYDELPRIAIFPKQISAYQFIQKMGRTRDAGKTDALAELNQLFGRSFLRGPTTYQLTRTYSDPVERWHGKEGSPEILETFKTNVDTP